MGAVPQSPPNEREDSSLERISQSTGLKVHPGKTKVLKMNTSVKGDIKINEVPIEEVTSFTYLGSIIDGSGGTISDVKARIGKARIAFQQLKSVWRSGNISTKTKLRIFNSNVKSVLLY